jgi:hypothetical protein
VDGAAVEFRDDVSMLHSAVVSVDPEKAEVTTEIGVLLGASPNRLAGLTFTDEAYSKTWKGALLSGDWRGGPATYKFEGPPLAKDTFKDADGDGRVCVLAYEFGPGDSLLLPIHVSVRRDAPGRLSVSTDTACTVNGQPYGQ